MESGGQAVACLSDLDACGFGGSGIGASTEEDDGVARGEIAEGDGVPVLLQTDNEAGWESGADRERPEDEDGDGQTVGSSWCADERAQSQRQQAEPHPADGFGESEEGMEEVAEHRGEGCGEQAGGQAGTMIFPGHFTGNGDGIATVGLRGSRSSLPNGFRHY